MLTHSRRPAPTKNHSHSTLHVAGTVMRAVKIVDVGDPTRDRSRQDALRRRCSDRQRGSTLRRSAATETATTLLQPRTTPQSPTTAEPPCLCAARACAYAAYRRPSRRAAAKTQHHARRIAHSGEVTGSRRWPLQHGWRRRRRGGELRRGSGWGAGDAGRMGEERANTGRASVGEDMSCSAAMQQCCVYVHVYGVRSSESGAGTSDMSPDSS
jgi:hypothetical protein